MGIFLNSRELRNVLESEKCCMDTKKAPPPPYTFSLFALAFSNPIQPLFIHAPMKPLGWDAAFFFMNAESSHILIKERLFSEWTFFGVRTRKGTIFVVNDLDIWWVGS
jgi:hypothetical protein